MSTAARFVRLRSRAVVLDLADVDTDQIVPARFLKRPREEGFGQFLFHALRRNPDGVLRADFPLNAASAAGAQVLVAGANFGCGSSREGAVYALLDGGFRAVIAPSFGDIFSGNALKNGLLPVVLAADVVQKLGALVRRAPGTEITVDLERRRVECEGLTQAFDVDPFAREALLGGIDEIGLTLKLEEAILRFEEADALRRPWL
jgi:3-isopropylmalate/(R)-2-methylmalate dehydratase small subunit